MYSMYHMKPWSSLAATKRQSSATGRSSGSFIALCKCATLNNTCNFDKRHRCKNEDGLDDPAIPTPPFNVMVDQEGSDVQMEKVLWEPIGNASEAAFIKLTQKLG